MDSSNNKGLFLGVFAVAMALGATVVYKYVLTSADTPEEDKTE